MFGQLEYLTVAWVSLLLIGSYTAADALGWSTALLR